MFGLFYMGWVMVSHIGAKIREFDHYINRHVDNKTNTYVDIYGNRRDNNTNQLSFVTASKLNQIIAQRLVRQYKLKVR